MKKIFFSIIAILYFPAVQAQFAPQAGVAGSTAIKATDSKIVDWAVTCVVERGYIDIADKSQGKATLGDAMTAVGPSDFFLVSLGDSGVATLTFTAPIFDGPGPDFVVFENGFANPNDPDESFMELAFVEVSSDGVNFVRFPASCHIDSATQIPGSGVYSKASKVNNLAGKYIGGWGTPFDLQELAAEPNLDVNQITHVRIVDVIGDVVTHVSRDKDGRAINDPYPTAFISSGFDLEAVGVLNSKKFPATIPAVAKSYTLYPNPAVNKIVFNTNDSRLTNASYKVLDITGKTVVNGLILNNETVIDLNALTQGVYNLVVTDVNGNKWVERITKI